MWLRRYGTRLRDGRAAGDEAGVDAAVHFDHFWDRCLGILDVCVERPERQAPEAHAARPRSALRRVQSPPLEHRWRRLCYRIVHDIGVRYSYIIPVPLPPTCEENRAHLVMSTVRVRTTHTRVIVSQRVSMQTDGSWLCRWDSLPHVSLLSRTVHAPLPLVEAAHVATPYLCTPRATGLVRIRFSSANLHLLASLPLLERPSRLPLLCGTTTAAAVAVAIMYRLYTQSEYSFVGSSSVKCKVDSARPPNTQLGSRLNGGGVYACADARGWLLAPRPRVPSSVSVVQSVRALLGAGRSPRCERPFSGGRLLAQLFSE